MAVPPKRKSNRSQRRADQRGPQDSDPIAGAEGAPPLGVPLDSGGDAAGWIAAPPRTGCPPWHFYWCDGHGDWHHHTEGAVGAIEASLPQP